MIAARGRQSNESIQASYTASVYLILPEGKEVRGNHKEKAYAKRMNAKCLIKGYKENAMKFEEKLKSIKAKKGKA